MNDKVARALRMLRDPFWWVELSDMEREAVRLVSRGKSIPKIVAPALGVSSTRTVYNVLERAMKKINLAVGADISWSDLPDVVQTAAAEILEED